MSTTAQYASLPKNGVAQASVANTNRDGTGALVVVAQASANVGCRIDALAIQAAGTTTAGMLRFFLTKGRPGGAIASITFAGTTATVTTVLPHGLTTGQLLNEQGASPDEYNVTDTAITVTSATTFAYLMATAPTANAQVLGNFSTTPAVPTSRLFLELPVTAAVPSATVQAFAAYAVSGVNKGYLPLVLQPGWSLRAAMHNAEAVNIIPTLAGDFA